MGESRIHDFLRGTGLDGAGRSADAVLRFDDARLEAIHDYIQWIFPLPEPSGAVPGSPVLARAEATAIRADPEACRTLDRAAATMAGFYARNDHWLVPHDHNHLRITRILRSLILLRGVAPARAFLDGILARIPPDRPTVSSRSRAFWEEAVRFAPRLSG